MKENFARRLVVMFVGVFFIGLGVTLFRLSLMGNDPSTALAIAFGNKAGLALSIALIIANTAYFLVEILLGRRMIGIGTFVNWFGVGYAADFCAWLIGLFLTMPGNFLIRLAVMAVGVLILSLGGALYQTANVGIAPYDAVSLIMAERLPLPYFWCRIITDSCCAAAAWLLGGIIGLGTLVCALGLGPFITFFTRTVAQPLCETGKKV